MLSKIFQLFTTFRIEKWWWQWWCKSSNLLSP